jgi:hypothetical protein
MPNKISLKQRTELLSALQTRFEKNMRRHPGITWSQVMARLEAATDKLVSLQEMERTGGEPDVIDCDPKTGRCLFVDCSKESPVERRSLCYDREALESRKEHPPRHTAVDLAAEMGIELLSEEAYLKLQMVESFDLKTSSWLQTPAELRKLGGALYGECRYARVFIGHNGAQSYYAVRGFRGCLRV